MSAPVPDPTAAQALETLRQLGFRLDSTTGSYRLIRVLSSAQAALYSLKGNSIASSAAAAMGQSSASGNLGNIVWFNDAEYSSAAIAALALARAILKDESTRLTTLNQFQKPSVESKPYG